MDKDLAIAGVIITLSLGFFFMNIIPNWLSIIGTIVAGVFSNVFTFHPSRTATKKPVTKEPSGDHS